MAERRNGLSLRTFNLFLPMNTNINQSSEKLRYIDLPASAPGEESLLLKAARVPAAACFVPFGNIALSFSGGGFRAACFSLGVLSFLNEIKDEDGVPLLQHVRYISSASGGSITTAAYALSVANGCTFDIFYKKLHDNLAEDKMLKRAMELLADDSIWRAPFHKRRNLINAFAMAYDKMLYEGQTAGHLSTSPHSDQTGLEEICLNATEFYKGLPFRQSIYMKKAPENYHDVLYGNFAIKLPPQVSNPFRIADLVAASACFPAGFEPILFPSEFLPRRELGPLFSGLRIQPQEFTVEELKNLYYEKDIADFKGAEIEKMAAFMKGLQDKPNKDSVQIGLMDGGITDNQAIDSVVSAQAKRMENASRPAGQGTEHSYQPFDLIMLNDVASHFMSPYKLPDPRKQYQSWQFLTIRSILVISTLLFIFSGLAGAGAFFSIPFEDPVLSKMQVMFSVTVFLVSGGAIALLWALRRRISGTVNDTEGFNLKHNFSEDIQKNLFRYFARVPLRILLRMISERINSVLALNNEVFLKRTRYLLLREIFQLRNWKGRVLSNNIYDLAFSNNNNRISQGSIDPVHARYLPRVEMQRVAQAAFRMPTVLWFDKKNQDNCIQAAVIATGQFSTCYNLLVYLDQISGFPECTDEASRKRLTHIRKQLEEAYREFNRNSFYLYNRISGTDISDNSFRTPDSFLSFKAFTSAHEPTP